MRAGRAAALITICCVPVSGAFMHEMRVGDVACTVYAPDWTWQGRNVNILVVAENRGNQAAGLALELGLPPGKGEHFAYDGPRRLAAEFEPGGSQRLAFVNIEAKTGVPRQTYGLTLTAASGGESREVSYPLRTIRGQAFGQQRWVALAVPAGVAAVWCAAFVFALKRFTERGAWRRPPPAMDEPEEKPAWIDKTPA